MLYIMVGHSEKPGAGLRSVATSDSAVDRVTAEIRRAVLSGTMPAGEPFSIAELTAQLGVSHIPVREALRRLDAQGLIVQRPGRSAIVSPLNKDELRAIYRLRKLIEPDLAARSLALLTESHHAQTTELLDVYVHAPDNSDRLWTAHHDLHMVLIRPAATEWDLRILDQIWHACDRYTRLVFDTYAMTPNYREGRIAAHSALIAAARSGSSAEIARAVSEHLAENEADCVAGLAVVAGETPSP